MFGEGFGFDVGIAVGVDFEKDIGGRGMRSDGDADGVVEEGMEIVGSWAEGYVPEGEREDAVECVGGDGVVLVGGGDKIPSAVVLLEEVGVDVDVVCGVVAERLVVKGERLAVDDALEDDVEIAHACECVVVFERYAGGCFGDGETGGEALECDEHPLHERGGGVGVAAEGSEVFDCLLDGRLIVLGELVD